MGLLTRKRLDDLETKIGSLADTSGVTMPAGSIGTTEIADVAITVGKLATDAVETAKIKDLNVTTGKLAADAVTGAKLADDAVDSEHYTDGSIDTAHVANSAVTVAKLGAGVAYIERLGTPSVADADRFLLSVAMQATAYTPDETTLPAGNPPRNVTVTHTAVGTADTLGDLVVEGTDVDDGAISETITIVSGTEAAGVKAFKTITSLTTAGWVIDGVEATADTITVGFGALLGLSRVLASANEVVVGLLNRAVQAATIAVDAANVEGNTVDMSAGTYNGSKLADLLMARP